MIRPKASIQLNSLKWITLIKKLDIIKTFCSFYECHFNCESIEITIGGKQKE